MEFLSAAYMLRDETAFAKGTQFLILNWESALEASAMGEWGETFEQSYHGKSL